ncbi:MAG: carbohydrate kinase family protein [Candidatus Bathyarchaeota archaeon]|nr:carbohydrate kinase family protein [Candidatus Bathyarchaeota archaeon]
MKLDVIGFGAINLDKICRVNKIVGPGEESFITSIILSPGGSAANTIVGLSKLNQKAGYIGKVGPDEDGDYLLNSFKKVDVNIDGIIRSKKGFSGQSLIFEDRSGEREIYIYPGENDEILIDEINIDYACNAKILHLTSFVGNKPFKAQKELVKSLTDVVITFDPGDIYASKGLIALDALIENSSIIFTNTSKNGKAVEIITKKDYKDACKILIEKGADIIAVKLGNQGCYIENKNESYLVKPYKVDVVSTTGAGDAFNAGFIYSFLKGKDLFYCGKFGNFVASRCITQPGAREGLPTLENLKEFENTLQ